MKEAKDFKDFKDTNGAANRFVDLAVLEDPRPDASRLLPLRARLIPGPVQETKTAGKLLASRPFAVSNRVVSILGSLSGAW